MRSMTDEGLTPALTTSTIAYGDAFSYNEKAASFKKIYLRKLRVV